MGLLYGLLAGAWTFGFLAPMLGVIFLEGKMALGVVMIVVFGLGLCLPIVLAGCGIGVMETKNYARFRASGETYRRSSRGHLRRLLHRAGLLQA